MTRVRPVALALLIALSACGGGTEEAANERKTAAGEVLGGSISDAMLPLDTVQSQSPPLREKGDSSPAASGGAEPGPADAPAPTAAATPEQAEPGAEPAADTQE